MTDNPILSELYAVRAQILQDHGDDLRRISTRSLSDFGRRTSDFRDSATDNPMHGSGDVGQIHNGQSIVAAP